MLEMVIFTVSSRCNARCKMCNMWQRGDPDIPVGKVREVLSSRSMKDTLVNLLISGGEPTLHKDLPEIFAAAFEELGSLEYASFFTNSLNTRLVSEAVGKTLDYRKKSGREDVSLSVTLSLDGIGATHDNVRGVKGAFGCVMENYLGLKALSEKDFFSISFSCLVQKENIASGGAFFLLHAADRALLPITFPVVYGKDIFLNRDCDDAWSVPEEFHEELIKFYEELVQRAESGGLLIDNGYYYKHLLRQLKGGPRTLPCLFRQKKACVIDSDGSVYLCDMTKESLMGNIYERSFDDIWNSEQKDSIHTKMLRHCQNCFSSCVGSGRYQLKEVWHSGGMAGITKLSLREFRKRMKRVARLMREYRYAVIPRL